MVLPPPYRNPEWPQPGGFASNAMYHLDASGHLRQVWDADAGKGSDSDFPPHRLAGGGRRTHLRRWIPKPMSMSSTPAHGQAVWDKRLAPKNGTDMPTLWGLLGKPNTIDPVTGMGGGVAYDARQDLRHLRLRRV